MRDIDETDRQILGLLLDDARRSWREIADVVDLSPPAVADRVERLEELGVVRGFTLDIDRTKLRGGTPVLVTVATEPGAGDALADALADADRVEHLFATADDRVVFSAVLDEGDAVSVLHDSADLDDVRDYEVSLLRKRSWSPSVEGVELALTCDECGNTVTSEGESERIDGELYHFCCGSCRDSFVEMYEELREGADL
ncbi:MAG: AsnC family transcriptional regulator [Haloarculaceae archaeon]